MNYSSRSLCRVVDRGEGKFFLMLNKLSKNTNVPRDYSQSGYTLKYFTAWVPGDFLLKMHGWCHYVMTWYPLLRYKWVLPDPFPPTPPTEEKMSCSILRKPDIFASAYCSAVYVEEIWFCILKICTIIFKWSKNNIWFLLYSCGFNLQKGEAQNIHFYWWWYSRNESWVWYLFNHESNLFW